MEYNSQKDLLIISEYGRNVQNLIYHAKSIENQEERQHFVETLIDLMQQMNPSNKNSIEYREKLWRHLFRIADYEINVIPPSGVVPTPESSHVSPSNLVYPHVQRKFRHYGMNVKEMLKKAESMEDQEMQQEFLMVIASYMKLAYRTWNREHFVSDDIIKADIKTMSNGKLQLPDDATIDISDIPIKKRSRSHQNGYSRGKGRKGSRKRR